jgi:hypothetical protein
MCNRLQMFLKFLPPLIVLGTRTIKSSFEATWYYLKWTLKGELGQFGHDQLPS